MRICHATWNNKYIIISNAFSLNGRGFALQCPFHITIAFLNVRSIVAKMPDIKQDNNLKSASVKCFCETWLNVSQLSPIVQHDEIDIRCDRTTCESKGGVMVCVPSQMKTI